MPSARGNDIHIDRAENDHAAHAPVN
jgi:hypothetical protein